MSYFHIVFTLPSAIGDIAHQNKATIYGLLFKAAAEAMLIIAADPKIPKTRLPPMTQPHPRSPPRVPAAAAA